MGTLREKQKRTCLKFFVFARDFNPQSKLAYKKESNNTDILSDPKY